MKEYCVHCGEPLKHGEFIVYSMLPYDTNSANEGESGVICFLCDEERINNS